MRKTFSFKKTSPNKVSSGKYKTRRLLASTLSTLLVLILTASLLSPLVIQWDPLSLLLVKISAVLSLPLLLVLNVWAQYRKRCKHYN